MYIYIHAICTSAAGIDFDSRVKLSATLSHLFLLFHPPRVYNTALNQGHSRQFTQPESRSPTFFTPNPQPPVAAS
ncbi:hypothetical protein HanRHA438_Chr17g0794231 [Helianthus annuus]|nr:hypothetical protein HanRHA438_Chr17g0794231 [Helianthus annuus]